MYYIIYGWFYVQYIEQNISYGQYVTMEYTNHTGILMDINMDINICRKASYFGSSDLTVKCIQSKKNNICMSK
jgi:hypothetical protein